MSQSSCCKSWNATAKWWFSRTDSSLYISAISESVDDKEIRKNKLFYHFSVNWGTIHTMAEKFENATLFLQLDLMFTLIRQKTELFENDCLTIIMIFPCPSFPQTQIQNDRRLLCFQIPPPWCEQGLKPTGQYSDRWRSEFMSRLWSNFFPNDYC